MLRMLERFLPLSTAIRKHLRSLVRRTRWRANSLACLGTSSVCLTSDGVVSSLLAMKPLRRSEWVWGVCDYWTLVRDWYRQTLGIKLRDWQRPQFRLFRQSPMFETALLKRVLNR